MKKTYPGKNDVKDTPESWNLNLRLQAEEAWNRKYPYPQATPPVEEMQWAIQELQVHQIELEMQNEELRRTRAEVEAGLKRYRDLYDFAPVGYLTLTRDGSILQANLNAARLLGVERERLAGSRFGLMVAANDRQVFSAFLDMVFAGQHKIACKVTLCREEDPPAVPQSVGCRPISDACRGVLLIEASAEEGGQTCRAVLVDISASVMLAEQMVQSEKLVGLSNLSAGVAHEINTPLQIITSSSETLLSRLKEESLDREGLLRRVVWINQSSWRIARIVRSLLDYAHGTPDILAPASLNTLVSSVLPLVGAQNPMWSNIQLITDLAENLPDFVCDRSKIIQALINLLSNAQDALPDGGVVRICTRFDPQTQLLSVALSDNGKGIPEDAHSRVFDPFFSTKPVGQSSGLGLSVAFGIVKSHGGEITLDSTPGEGATFTLYFPLVPPAVESQTAGMGGRYEEPG